MVDQSDAQQGQRNRARQGHGNGCGSVQDGRIQHIAENHPEANQAAKEREHRGCLPVCAAAGKGGGFKRQRRRAQQQDQRRHRRHGTDGEARHFVAGRKHPPGQREVGAEHEQSEGACTHHRGKNHGEPAQSGAERAAGAVHVCEQGQAQQHYRTGRGWRHGHIPRTQRGQRPIAANPCQQHEERHHARRPDTNAGRQTNHPLEWHVWCHVTTQPPTQSQSTTQEVQVASILTVLPSLKTAVPNPFEVWDASFSVYS